MKFLKPRHMHGGERRLESQSKDASWLDPLVGTSRRSYRVVHAGEIPPRPSAFNEGVQGTDMLLSDYPSPSRRGLQVDSDSDGQTKCRDAAEVPSLQVSRSGVVHNDSKFDRTEAFQ